ncbi:MAG TPA: phospholipase D-like domain-containing protein [Verrucomicrobiae bacterium]|nr:phospholipase D-like domain-containing protein [Verrucomicrobiae bacterium]
MKLLPADIYYQQLVQHLNRAQKDIVLAAMVCYFEPGMEKLFAALEASAARGVKIHIIIDAYNDFLFSQDFNFFKARAYKQRIRATNNKLQKLAAQGVAITRLGSVGINPFKGRFHQKVSLIDDVVFFAGGVNLTHESFLNNDYMLFIKDATLARRLNEYYDNEVKTNESFTYEISPSHTLLIDGGKPNESIIYQRAIELSTRAKRITYVSQMAPSGPLAGLLAAKHATIYTNRVAQLLSPAAIDQLAFFLRYRLANSYQKEQFLHAKYLLFELESGERKLLSGSHNFSYRGVRYGTHELALESSDASLYAEFAQFGKDNLT